MYKRQAYNVAIQDELLDYEAFDGTDADEEKLTSHNYALTERQQSAKLKRQLEAFKAYRTATLNSARTGSRVQEVTVAGNTSCLLRFLGWAAAHGGITESLDFEIFKRDCGRKLIDDYTEWLQRERQISFSSISNYINGLMQCMLYVSSEMMGPEPVTAEMEATYAAAFNLRTQAQSAAMEDLRWKERHPQWLSWDDCQLTRHNCIQRYEIVMSDPGSMREAQLEACQELVLLCLLTIMPPERDCRHHTEAERLHAAAD